MMCACAIHARYRIGIIHEKVVYNSLLILRIASPDRFSQESESRNDFITDTHHQLLGPVLDFTSESEKVYRDMLYLSYQLQKFSIPSLYIHICLNLS